MKITTFKNIINLESVDSTNTFLKNNSEKYPDGTVVFAKEQLNGKGRFDRKWEGEKERSIFSSFLIKNIASPSDAIKYTFLFSLGVKSLLEKYIDKNKIVLKWPNDILIGNKKICGILSEYSRRSAVIGIGLNVFNFDSSQEISDLYIAMLGVAEDYDFETIKDEFIEAINFTVQKYRKLDIDSLTNVWFKEAGICGKKVEIKDSNQESLSGVVTGINEIGELIITTDEGVVKSINSGDICYND